MTKIRTEANTADQEVLKPLPDPAEVVRWLGVSAAWVRDHATRPYNRLCRSSETAQRKLAENTGGKSAIPERVYLSGSLQPVVADYRLHDGADLHEAEQRVNRLLKTAFGHLRLTEFTSKTLNNYIRGRQQLGRKIGAINRELAHLRRAFRLGFEHDPHSFPGYRSSKPSRR